MKNEKELREVLLSLKELCGKIEAMLDEGYVYVAPDTKKYDEQVELTDHQLKVKTSQIFKEIGIPASLLGYGYLRYAISLAYRDQSYMREITKKLYPAIAEEFDTTPMRAERAIRHAIEVAFDRTNAAVIDSYFGYTVSANKGKLTNSEFIAIVVDKLELEGV